MGDAIAFREHKRVPPDPALARAVGRHHTLETALADLVDNSVDAGATRVRIRFLQAGGHAVGLRVIDDGRGMDGEQIDEAMTYAKRRDYGAGDLGHFGIGLKAASLSQADTLLVFSQRYGAAATGRGIRAADPTSIGLVDAGDARATLVDAGVDGGSGTVVEWRSPRTFITSLDRREQSAWLEAAVTGILAHLGIVFHRMLGEGLVGIAVDVLDLDSGRASAPRTVRAIDPFGYRRLPGGEYPASMRVRVDDREAEAMLHLWPAQQSGRPEFRLGGRPGTLFQGFYVYRHDRLLQIGGWNTLATARPELEYARVAMDIDDGLETHITINPEKSGLEFDSDLAAALAGAVYADGRRFADFLDGAAVARRESRRYTKRAVKLARPDRGFDADMIRAFEDSVDEIEGGPVDIRWRVMQTEAPFTVDVEARCIFLNEQYRGVIAGPASPGANPAHDAPLVKTLLMIVFSKHFDGAYLGSHEKLEIQAWEQLLTAALRDELEQQAERESARDEDDGEGARR